MIGLDSTLSTYRRHETILLLVGLGVLAAVFLLHVAFAPILGLPSRGLVLILGLLSLTSIAKLIWLHGLTVLPSQRFMRTIGVLNTVWVLAGAFGAALVGEGQEHHYYVLMLPALISAAFRFRLRWAIATALLASGLMMIDIWQFTRVHPQADLTEYFEGAVVCIIFCVVTVIVWLLADARRQESDRLAESLRAHEATRDKLIAEEKLAAIGRLASAIAHEIRNPVAMISSALATVDGPGVDATTRAQLYAVAAAEMDRLARLTGDFLAYARQRPPDCGAVDLAEVVSCVRDVTQAESESRGVTLVCEPGERALAWADRAQVQQILLNLVKNAFDAAPAGSRVAVEARAGARRSVVAVTNAGPAIPESVVELLYEPFFTTKPQGTGLGLGLARRLAEAQHGTLALVRNQDGAIVFELTLPAREDEVA